MVSQMIRSFACRETERLFNDQWRICFCWEGQEAFDVEIVNYH